jgi:hypothetical protein
VLLEVKPGVEHRGSVARKGLVVHAQRLGQSVRGVERGEMAPRAAHGAIGGDSGVEKQRATESDTLRSDRELRGRHVLRERLEVTPGLFEEIVVIARKSGFRDEIGGACDYGRGKANDPQSFAIINFERFHENPPEVRRSPIGPPDRHELRSSTNTSMGSG